MEEKVLIRYERSFVGFTSPQMAKFICLLIEPEQVEISESRPPCYQIVDLIGIRTSAA